MEYVLTAVIAVLITSVIVAPLVWKLAIANRIKNYEAKVGSAEEKAREIIDEAIYHAGRKNMSHFMDVLFGKRYDDEDMIVLREKDFV